MLVDVFILIVNTGVAMRENNTTKGGKVKATECKCKQCGYTWEARKKLPKACPRCKRYDWRVKK